MELLTLFVFALFACVVSNAQIVICDTMPLAYNQAAMSFTAAPSSFGDSMLTIPITNNTTTSFGYPRARLIPQTPFPPGMSLATTSTMWYPFASSYNPGQTMPASFFFNVTQPVPSDYSVTFDLYVSNFSPLAIDSCVFATPVIVNFNPSSLSLKSALVADNKFILAPNPAADEFIISFHKQTGEVNTIDLVDANGRLVKSWSTKQGELITHTGTLKNGMYYLVSKNTQQREKLIIAH